MQEAKHYIAAVYCRYSKEDDPYEESSSIGTQRAMLTDFCQQNGYEVYKTYVDDGYSGMNFRRPGFQELLEDIEKGCVNLVVTKDLSRLGRDYIMTGYYSEIFFPERAVRYIAIGDNFDSDKNDNEIAPFKNILNEMYARDISRKIKAAKHQQAKQGLFIGSQTPYGYQKDPNQKNHLIVDPVAAEAVRAIFSLAESGMGSIVIARELRKRQYISPAAHKLQNGDARFVFSPSITKGDSYLWQAATINQILCNRVYLGELSSLKTEVINCKTKQYRYVPYVQQIHTRNAHEAIIDEAQFEAVQQIRKTHPCPTERKRFNLFRGKLFCESCGHPLMISQKQLKEKKVDMYLCMYHYTHPEICPKTHRVYHDMLYPYVLQQIRQFAKSMRRRKVNSNIGDYSDIEELTPEILNDVIDRIEVGHVSRKSKPGSVIQIYWRLK